MVNSSSALANPHAARPTTNAVFLDPSGRRWRRLRLVMVGVVVAVLGLLAYAVPHLYDTPALDSRGDALGPELTSAETGEHVPLVGEGPLVRVLEVRREGGVVNGYDPFTRRLETTFSTAQAQHIGDQGYAIQRFGYSATATKTMSLTFDDGPDPRWTPELLNVLSANKVPATFFATGTMIARHPEIIRREVREGHAIANHSLTHTDVSDTSRWRARTELVATDRVIRAVTGQEVGYFRLPYEGDDEKTTQATIDGILRAQRYGYLVTSHDFDTDDWAYASRERKGEIPLPPLTGQNITMLMHDGGGEGRKLTVDYVRRLIPYAKAHGYTFQTMPQAQPQLADRVSTVRPTVWDQLTLKVVQAIYVWPSVVLQVLFLFALASVILIGAVNCLLAAHRHRSRARQEWPGPGELQLPVSVVIPAYNEQDVIRRTIASVLASQYPLVEVLVVDDGSTDSTADAVREMARRNPRVVLIRQANSGKASALNHGLSRARGDYIVTLDADTNLTPTTVGNMIRHFAVDADGRLGAVAGVVGVGNRERNVLTRWQALEYLTQIGVERAAQDAMRAITIVPGACAAWRKDAVLAVGGYSDLTLAEDCDLSLSLQRAGWLVTQDDEAIAFTEVPDNVDALLAQRTRWVFGTLQAVYKHRAMLFRRRYGLLGWYVLPSYVLSIVVPIVFLPFVAFMGVRAAQEQGVTIVLAYFMLFLVAHLGVAVVGCLLMHERSHHLPLVPVYRVVYEPLRAYLLYTCVYMAVRGVRAGWNKLARTGAVDTRVIRAITPQPLPIPQPLGTPQPLAAASRGLAHDDAGHCGPRAAAPHPAAPPGRPGRRHLTTSQAAHVRLLGPLALVGLVGYQAVGWAGISLALPSLPILAAVAVRWSRHRLTAHPSTRGQCWEARPPSARAAVGAGTRGRPRDARARLDVRRPARDRLRAHLADGAAVAGPPLGPARQRVGHRLDDATVVPVGLPVARAGHPRPAVALPQVAATDGCAATHQPAGHHRQCVDPVGSQRRGAAEPDGVRAGVAGRLCPPRQQDSRPPAAARSRDRARAHGDRAVLRAHPPGPRVRLGHHRHPARALALGHGGRPAPAAPRWSRVGPGSTPAARSRPRRGQRADGDHLPVDQPRHHARRPGHRRCPCHAGRGRDGCAGAPPADRPEWAPGRAGRAPARSGRGPGLPT